ncbi:MAG: hypothetical protein IKG82_04320 [Oscillospiraceae bacterium]|nr:hypothetical protein [Oscillospiraceae bacterium]
MEKYRTLSLALWWIFVIACVWGITHVFEKLRKKLEQKYLRYVGFAAGAAFSVIMAKPMWKLQIQRINLRDEAAAYRSSISDSMDSNLIEAIKNHNSKVEELQSKVNEHPVIYWFMCGDFGHYEDFFIRLPE